MKLFLDFNRVLYLFMTYLFKKRYLLPRLRMPYQTSLVNVKAVGFSFRENIKNMD